MKVEQTECSETSAHKIQTLGNNLFPYKYPNNFIPVILPATSPIKMEQSVPKRRHIKFRCRGMARKKEYNKANHVRQETVTEP